MNRSVLLGVAGVGAIGVVLALTFAWRGDPTTTAPLPTDTSPVESASPPPGAVQTAAAPTTPQASPSPSVRPRERRPPTPTDAQFSSTNDEFNAMAHEPAFDHIAPNEAPEATLLAIQEVLADAADFERDMRQLAAGSSAEVGAEAMQRASIVYERVAEQLPPRPPESLSPDEAEVWTNDMDARRAELHERARSLLQQSMDR